MKMWREGFASAIVGVTAFAATGIIPAAADPPPAGPDSCINGYVPREARSGDTVCVTPDVHDRTLSENANPAANKQPGGGAYGPDTCASGFVWREAFSGDTICVTPGERSATKADNAAAASHRTSARPQQGPAPHTGIVLELTGSGTASTVDVYDPAALPREYNRPLPYAHTGPVLKSGDLVQIVGEGKGSAKLGCRITVDGHVVAEKAVGAGSQCIYTAP